MQFSVIVDRGQEPRPTVTGKETVVPSPELAKQPCPTCSTLGQLHLVRVPITHPQLTGGCGVWLKMRCEHCHHEIPPGTWTSTPAT